MARLADQTAQKVEDLEQQVAVAKEQAVVLEERVQAAQQKAAAADAAKAVSEDRVRTLLDDIAQVRATLSLRPRCTLR